MSKGIVYLITIVLCLLLQMALAPAIQLGGAQPNFLLIPVLLISLRSGYASGSVVGFLCGLFEDFAGSGAIGCMALTLTIVATLVGLAGSAMETQSPLVLCILGVIASLLTEFGYGIAAIFAHAESGGVAATMLGYALPSALYTAVFVCIALVTINMVMADESAAQSRLGSAPLGGRPANMPRMKSRLK